MKRTYDVVVTREVLGIRQKPTKRRRALPGTRLLALPFLVGLTAGLAHLLTSPAYRVHGATVRGNALVDAQAIYQMSMVDGQNLFLLSTRGAEAGIERLPYVKRASVRARLPAQVGIVIEEFQPRWMWIAGDETYWIDETGNILPYNGPLEGAMTVVGPPGRALPVGASLEPAVVGMLQGFSSRLPEVQQVTYDEELGFVFAAGPGWPVRVGHDPAGLETRIAILNSLLPELLSQYRDVEFIDLRFAEQPYYRLR